MGKRVNNSPFVPGHVPHNKGKTLPVEILTPDEVRAILLACPDTIYGVRNCALFTLFYRTGLRLSEGLAVYPKDLDRVIGSVRVARGRGGKSRTVGIDAGGVEVIDRWTERRNERGLPDDAPLFCTMNGTPVWPSAVSMALKRIARRAGIEKRVHAHGLRHTFAYELMMEGVPMAIIQAQLGHSSLATTDRYLAHIAPKQVIETMVKRDWEP